jgi:hypothetical protein
MRSWKIKKIKGTESTQSKGVILVVILRELGISYLRVHEVKVKLLVWKKSNYLEVWITDVNKDHSIIVYYIDIDSTPIWDNLWMSGGRIFEHP